MENEYPEHAKVAAVKEFSQEVGRFLEWLGDQGKVIAEWGWDEVIGEERLHGDGIGLMPRLAQFYEIDLNKLEAEKLEMLTELRRVQHLN